MIFPAPKAVLFPVLVCNQHCHYCVNHNGDFDGGLPSNLAYKLAPTMDWVNAVRSIEGAKAINWLGGEPGLHPGIAEMVNACPSASHVSIGTNGSKLAVSRIINCDNRENFWVQISFHPSEIDAFTFSKNIIPLVEKFHGRIGVHTPDKLKSNDYNTILKITGVSASRSGLITQAEGGSLDPHESTKNPNSPKTVECPLNYWLPVAPNGDIYACHALLYGQCREGVIGNLFRGECLTDDTVRCSQYGRCNPCDVSRFTSEMHTMRWYKSNPHRFDRLLNFK